MRKQLRSLEEVNATVDTSVKRGFWSKLLAFVGPAYLVSVGYMDPGNWATDIAGGSKFGYQLIWVLLLSNLIAVLLQSLCIRLGVVRRMDLAQASKYSYPKYVNFLLYILAEIAIISCDLAEVLGMALGLQLLFGIPLIWGVMFTLLDTFLLILLINKGVRKLEAFILALITVIGLAFLFEMFFAQPNIVEIGSGFIPSTLNSEALYIAIGIIGATVMPHNLYLHSALVQTRIFHNDPKSIKEAIKFNTIDSVIALNIAFLVNAAILILAASTFFKIGMFDVSEIIDAHKFLAPMLGTNYASIFFAIALIAAGQSSTITGTLAGQIIMEGHINLRIQPWVRRLITRALAIVPAVVVISTMGEGKVNEMLILSQVILSLQLGFAVIPLIHFVSNKREMKEFAISNLVKVLAWISVSVIVILNIRLVIGEVTAWTESSQSPIVLQLILYPILVIMGALLFYIIFQPFIHHVRNKTRSTPHQGVFAIDDIPNKTLDKIAIAIDFSSSDVHNIKTALSLGGKEAHYHIIHIVETAGSLVYGEDIEDYETIEDKEHLEKYANKLRLLGFNISIHLGYGNPKKSIPIIVKKLSPDIVTMGSHGHFFLKDLIFGTTINEVRHKIDIPIFVTTKKK